MATVTPRMVKVTGAVWNEGGPYRVRARTTRCRSVAAAHPGRQSDHCSPKVCVFDFLLGTPEGVVYAPTEKRKTYFASLMHDALYQFLPDGLPFRRRHADRFFLVLLGESEFAPRWLYWAAVRLFGGLVWRATRRKRQTRGQCNRVAELFSVS